jgi:hypothetical protein
MFRTASPHVSLFFNNEVQLNEATELQFVYISKLVRYEVHTALLMQFKLFQDTANN